MGICLGLALALAATAHAQTPVRLVEMDASAISAEVRRQNALVALPRAEFESLVRKAAAAIGENRNPATQLLEANYQARLDSGSLAGTGRWVFHNPSHGAAVHRVGECNLAFRGRPTFDGQPAVFGEFDALSSGVLLSRSGASELAFEWSARAETRPEGSWFFLRTPPAPVAVLDLEVPADQLVECPSHRPVELPSRPDAPGLRTWRLIFGSQKQADLEILVKPATQASRPGLLWCATTSTYTLTPGQCEARFVLDLRAAHQGRNELRLLTSPSLVVQEIVRLPKGPRAVSWRTVAEGGATSVIVKLDEPFERYATLEVRCRVEAPSVDGNPARFRLPGVVVADAWAEPESLRVRIASSLRLSQWNLGDFQLLEAAASEREGGQSFEVLKLQQAGPNWIAGRRPSAVLRLGSGEVTAQQDCWWRLSPEASTLTAITTWQVRTGPVFGLSIELPPSAEVEDAEVVGGDQAVTWLREPSGILTMEFREPLMSKASVRTRVKVRLPIPQVGAACALPTIRPLAARLGDCSLALSLPASADSRAAPPWHYRWRRCSAEVLPAPSGAHLPWSESGRLPDAFCKQRGAVPSGEIELVAAQSPELRSQSTIEVEKNEALIVHDFVVEAASEPAAPLVVSFIGDADKLRWRSNPEASSGFSARRLGKGPNGLDRWEINLPARSQGPVKFSASERISLSSRSEIALPWSPPHEHRLLCRKTAESTPTFHKEGLTAIDPPEGMSHAWKYGPEKPRLVIDLAGPSSIESELPPAVSEASLIAEVQRDGRVYYHYRAEIVCQKPGTQTLRIPQEAQLDGVSVNGVTVVVDAGSEIPLDLPAGRAVVTVRYRIVKQPSLGALCWTPSLPAWQGSVVSLGCRHFIGVPEGQMLLWPPMASRVEGPLRPRSWTDAMARVAGLARRAPARPTTAAELQDRWQELRKQQPTATLGAVLERLQDPSSSGSISFVMDLLGLEEIQVSYDTPIDASASALPWESLGICAIGSSEAVLLTTPARLAALGLSAQDQPSELLDAAMATTVLNGFDATGTLCSLRHWKRRGSAAPSTTVGLSPGRFFEVPEGMQHFSSICVEEWWLHGAGALAVTLWGLLALSRKRSWMLVTVMGVLLGFLVLVWGSPPFAIVGWWLILGCGVLGLAAWPTRLHSGWAASTTQRTLAVALLGTSVLLSTSWLQAQATQDNIAFLLRDPAKAGGGETVLAPRELVQRLRKQAESAPVQIGYVLLTAEYDGHWTGSGAEFKAAFRVELLDADPVDVALPLKGIRLIRAFLDSAPTLASPLGKGDGLVIPVEGKGTHLIEVHFQLPASVDEAEGQLQLQAPAISSSRLKLTLPKTFQDVRLLGARGRQEIVTSADGASLQADLGRMSEFAIRWRSAASKQPTLSVRETYLLELESDDILLRGVVHVEVRESAVRQLRLDLPDALLVRAIEIKGVSEAAQTARLLRWRVEVENGRRLLVADLAHPLQGTAKILLDLVIRPAGPDPATWRELLRAVQSTIPGWPSALLSSGQLDVPPPTPTPLQVVIPGLQAANRRETLIACRAVKLRVTDSRWSAGLIPVADGAALRAAWPSELGGSQGLSLAAAGTNVQAPGIALSISPELASIESNANHQLQVDLQGAEVRTKLDLIVRQGTCGLVQLRIPGEMEVSDVQGADVLRWGQHDDLLEVWLKRLVGDQTALTIAGWQAATPEGQGSASLQLAGFTLVGGKSGHCRYEVVAKGGARLESRDLQGLVAGEFETGLVFTGEGRDFSGTVAITALPIPAASVMPGENRPASDNPEVQQAGKVLGVFRSTRLSLRGDIFERDSLCLDFPSSALVRLRLPDQALPHLVTFNGLPVDEIAWSGAMLEVKLPAPVGIGILSVYWSRASRLPQGGELELFSARPESSSGYPVVWQVMLPADLSPVSSVFRPHFASGGEFALATATMIHKLLQRMPADRAEERSALRAALLEQLAEVRALRQASVSSRVLEELRTLENAYAATEGAGIGLSQASPRAADAASRLETGFPWSAATLAHVFAQEPDSVVLRVSNSRSAQWATVLQQTIVALGLAALLLLLARMDNQLILLARVWPECLLVLGCVLVVYWPSSSGALLLIVLGLFARVWRMMQARYGPLSQGRPSLPGRSALPSTVVRPR